MSEVKRALSQRKIKSIPLVLLPCFRKKQINDINFIVYTLIDHKLTPNLAVKPLDCAQLEIPLEFGTFYVVLWSMTTSFPGSLLFTSLRREEEKTLGFYMFLVYRLLALALLIMIFEVLDASFSSLGCFVFEFYVNYFRTFRIFFKFKRLLFSTRAPFSFHHVPCVFR